MTALQIALLLVSYAIGPATLVEGRCSHCAKIGIASTVPGSAGAMCTLAGCGTGYYDEKGIYHAPEPCNTCTSMPVKCSMGHEVINTWRSF